MKKLFILSLFVFFISSIPAFGNSLAAPHFELMDLEGKTVKSQDFIGKQPVLLIFWATW